MSRSMEPLAVTENSLRKGVPVNPREPAQSGALPRRRNPDPTGTETSKTGVWRCKNTCECEK